jgi:diguanylate cyclase (GGDEF)-like protein
MKKFEHVLLYLTLASFAQFIYSFFHEPIPRWLRVSQGLLLAAAVIVVVTPGLETTSQLLTFLYVMFTVMTLGMLWLTVSRMRAGDRDAVFIGVGTVVVGAAFANDAMVGRSFYVGPRFGVWGFVALVVGMSLALAYRFNRALVEVESLRQDLEQRVDTRTRELSAAYKKMEDLALRDGLTNLLNRRSLQERAMIGLAVSKRKKLGFALAMVDIDHFKTVNDTLGHAAGDQVLTQLAKRLTACVRASDDVGRWGGEEFLVLFPDCDRDIAAQAAERLRAQVSEKPVIVEGDVALNVTVSVGVAVVDDPAPSTLILDALVRRADDALYAAKDGGRNQVVVAS